jgi:hypothetical protein
LHAAQEFSLRVTCWFAGETPSSGATYRDRLKDLTRTCNA